MDTNDTQNSLTATGTVVPATEHVDNPGQSQAHVEATTTVENVAQTPGPDAAFAAMRQENERLVREASRLNAIAEDEGVKQFIAQRQATADAAKARAAGVPVETNQRLEQIEASLNAQKQMQTEQAAIGNLRTFANKFDMDDNTVNAFATWMDTNHPDMADLASTSPNFNFEPYLAAFSPHGYSGFISGQANTANTAKPVFIPGHGNNTTSANAAEAEAADKFIKELVKD